MNTFTPIRLKVVCLALMAVYPVLSQAGVAGRVQFVAGDVRVVDGQGKERALRKGEDINEGDTVHSAAGASAQLKMIDGAVVAVRPDTQLKVTGYAFNGKQDGSENASFSLVKGGLRAITGLIGKVNKDKYKIETPTAVIGIRGTDHEPVVVLPASAAAAAGTQPGTYDKVNVGATSLTNQAGTAVIGANQVGFAASPTERPAILPKVPDFYRATPAPAQGKKQEQEHKSEQKQAQASGQQSTEQAAANDSAASDTGSATTSSASTASTTSSTTAATSQDTLSMSTAPALATPTTTLTATDASGNTLDLSTQTLSTSSGTTVALNPGTTTASLSANTELIATYPFNDPNNHPHPDVYYFSGPTQSVSRDAAGNVTGVSGTAALNYGYQSSLSQSGSVMTDLGKDAVTGLSWGRWQGGQVTRTSQYFGTAPNGTSGLGANDATGTFVIGGVEKMSSALGSGSLHWIAGSSSSPDYLPQVLTGTASYTLVGATHPTDLLGRTGTLNKASLSVNFTSQLASANVDFSIGADTWNMQSNNMQLHGSNFNSYSNCTTTSCTSSVSLTKNGAATSTTGTPTAGSAFGSIYGTLTGLGLNGAGLQYSVQEAVPTSVDPVTGQTYFTDNVIQGVAALSGPAQDTQTPFRAVGVADGWGNGMDGYYKSSTPVASTLYRGSVDGGEAPAARVVVDAAGGLTEFLGRAFDYTPLTAGTVSQTSKYDGTPAAIRIGTALNQDVGSFTTSDGTTVRWGRWEGGAIDIYSRDGSVKLGTIDNSGRSMHWVASPVMTSDATFTSLPLTGTATYSIAGNTRPTDLLGNVGTLNSATLTADFSNAKVNAGVNVSFNAANNNSSWSMSANNVPLRAGNGFESSTLLNGVNGITHTASCSGTTCGAQTLGNINGVFFGGGQGAVVMYGMSTGTTTTTTATTTSPATTTFNPSNAVSGVVVMKR